VSALNDALLLSHIPSIARISGRPNKMLMRWLCSGSFVPTANTGEQALVLERVDWDGLSEAVASDVDRLSRAARETLQVIQKVESLPKASAWMLIQTYYAAFYFAQAVLRICGKAPSFYIQGELNGLAQIVTLYGLTAPFSLRGQILVTLDQGSKTVTLRKGEGGASHEATWSLFSELLNDARELLKDAAISQERYLAADREVDSLMKIVSPPGAALKLSTMRNNVQYRQQMGGWSPYPGAVLADEIKRRVTAALTMRGSVSEFESSHHTAAIGFLESCLAVCFGSRNLLLRLDEMYSGSFLEMGYFKLEKQYAAH
jgi:hypothetical protein